MSRNRICGPPTRGAGLKVYFAKQDAADQVRDRFAKTEDLQGVVIGYLPVPLAPTNIGRPNRRRGTPLARFVFVAFPTDPSKPYCRAIGS